MICNGISTDSTKLTSTQITLGNRSISSLRSTQDLPRILPTSMKFSTATTATNHSQHAPAYETTTIICIGTAGNDEVVAVENFIDVGNMLGMSWVGLYV